MLASLLDLVRTVLSTAAWAAASLAAGPGPSVQVAPAVPPAGPAGPQVVAQTPAFAIFLADKDLDGTRELYRAELDGSGALKLNPPLVSGLGVTGAWLAPDASKVAYAWLGDLYVVGVDGGGHAKVSGTGLNNASIQSSDASPWSPDSQWLCYRRAESLPQALDLFAVRADGSGRVNLSQIVQPVGDVLSDWSWSPTSARVEFVADRTESGHFELYTATPDGQGLVLIEGGYANSNFGPEKAEWSPSGALLAYYGKYSAAGAVLRVSTPLGNGKADSSPTGVNINVWAWSPDGTRLAWTDNNQSGQHEIYVTFPNGSGQVKVNGPMQPGGGVTNMRWSPDSARIAYLANAQSSVQELYSGLASGAGAVKLNGPLPSGFLDMFDWHWSPSSSHVSYLAIQTLGKAEIFAAAADGSATVAVNGPLAGGSATHFGSPWSPDGQRLVFMADKLSPGVRELFTVRPDGAGLQKVSPTPVANGDVNAGARWTADSKRVVYIADLATNDLLELHSGRADGTGSVTISGPMVPGGDLWTFEVP